MILGTENLISDTVRFNCGKWYESCLRPSELLDVNGRLAPDIYIELTGTDEQVKLVTHRKLARLWLA
jgi:hypothetical protein